MKNTLFSSKKCALRRRTPTMRLVEDSLIAVRERERERERHLKS